MIRKYLLPSPATSKGRMKKPRAGVRSTRPKPKNSKCSPSIFKTEADCKAEEEQYAPDGANNIFCYAALADKQTGKLYTDATGALPTVSLDRMQYFFIAYDYDTNYIFAEPIADVKDATIIAAFDKVFTKLTKKGHKPTFNITDNQAAKMAIRQTTQSSSQRHGTIHPNV